MNPQSIIRRKRDGQCLSGAQVAEFVSGAVDGSWTRGQIGSMLMALFQQGMNLEETSSLLDCMMRSGDSLDVSGIAAPKADKHSTGGVGDKVSLVLAPLAACCGIAVPMLSGRGLGHTGGTLDKLESIPGYNVFLSKQDIHRQLRNVGCVIAGQTDDIVPADKILYAMRDETATVEHPSLIAASILSKKLVEGIDALLLDVKFGRGAFLQELGEAESLARLMVDLGKSMNCRVTAWLTRMDTPLGRAVGNGVEVEECIAILKNRGPDELTSLIVEQVAGMVEITGLATHRDAARRLAWQKLKSGEALQRFAAMIRAQGGDDRIIDNPSLLPQASNVVDIYYEESAPVYVADIDSRQIAEVVLDTGAGRRRAEDRVNHACGITHLVCAGDAVKPGDILARLHHASPGKEEEWISRICDSITFSTVPVDVPCRIHKEIN